MTTTTAPGERDLTNLLSTLTTTLHPSTFVFLTFPASTAPPATLYTHLTFREDEGLSVITTQESAASHRLESQSSFPCRMITLDVYSSLEAVGFIAVVATKLKERGMGVNPVSGFYHDHLFVPVGREAEAVEVLKKLAATAKSEKGI